MPLWMAAGLWVSVGGSALLLGAAIPEFQEHDFAGLITVIGFLVAFILTKLEH